MNHNELRNSASEIGSPHDVEERPVFNNSNASQDLFSSPSQSAARPHEIAPTDPGTHRVSYHYGLCDIHGMLQLEPDGCRICYDYRDVINAVMTEILENK